VEVAGIDPTEVGNSTPVNSARVKNIREFFKDLGKFTFFESKIKKQTNNHLCDKI
tara:strand:- start:108 stop:272 length:165 start_codon:yes stop_codon:yes gene_type:complete